MDEDDLVEPDEEEERFVPPQFQDFLYAYSCADSYKAYIGHEETDFLSIWTFYLKNGCLRIM
eukprot:TRINITY_DN14828_c0_g1_i1.p3 TRINITY_DN14828_c0_g1~~TRINITY_DN14828_c0_g1_i1.p3  ORF type:complete len:62 (+),score=11.59 TRINITY_DN14828_c0_g1_i1:497-682(+)